MADIDMLGPVTTGVIDLDRYDGGHFSVGDEYVLSKVFNDIVVVEFNDTDESGDLVKRGSLFVPVNSTRSLWRKGKVLLIGSSVTQCKVGDVVMFPHDKGIALAGINIKGHGKIKSGKILNEQRIFGVCEKAD